MEVVPLVIGIIGTLAAIASAFFDFFGFRSYWQQRRTQRLLEKSFGSELYGPETIERSTRYYIPPNCSSVDPAQEAEMRQVVTTEEKLFAAVDKHLAKDNPHRHLLLLADSGMGKTSFVLNYYARNQRLPKRQQQRLAVVPLGIPDADEYIAKIQDQPQTVIFLDAFDEDTKAIQDHIQDHRQRLLELMRACRNFRRVLITCRTQFFPRDQEIPRETGLARVGPRKAGEGATYEFWKLYLSPLDDEQVDEFLRQRYGFWRRGKRRRARELVKKIPLLSVRPMLLAYIPDLLESGAKIEYSFQLYEVLVEKWLERESHWVDPQALRQFSERLAVDLYANRQRRGAERIPRFELAVLAKNWNFPLEEWQLSGRSLLNRDAEGNYKFAHRSIMEYLYVKRLTAGDRACRGADLTDQMKAFLREMIPRHINEKKPIHDGMEAFVWELIQQHMIEQKPLPFDLTQIDLGKYRPPLRSQPMSILKDDYVKFTLKQLDFFGGHRHNKGKGIAHQYELHEKDGAKLVIDHATGLMWQQSGSPMSITYADAEEYIRELNGKRFAGYDDWRLPTLEEAMSLMEPTKHGVFYIHPIFDWTQRWIWTADKESAGVAWVALFSIGKCSTSNVASSSFVRAVRGSVGQSII
ncbi:MAG: DUF1566 domain-containing protein [candidate division KSB1 bacterium]|nr:DUF1566 domain-containing protein [candidate division KSB1 bacterium]MDZ7366003.1 DUF1566 domain-containing protein [candidate division KSB1 bacterium]MDZ7404120.1 DUF1566 domain-containing protein [candidate division KSB1 bacterium]